MKSQVNMTPPKETNQALITDLEKMIHQSSDKEDKDKDNRQTKNSEEIF